MHKIFLVLPSSLLEDCSDINSKTIKVGLIARAAAVFKVSNIIIYSTGEKGFNDNANFLKTLFEYIDCPQYLRKTLFPLREDLRASGLLPPLEAPHHKRFIEIGKIKSGELRQGVVVRRDNKVCYVDVGLDRLVPVYDCELPFNKRLNIQIVKGQGEVSGMVVNEPDYYWGFKTAALKNDLGGALRKLSVDLVIGTSKYGGSIIELFDKVNSEFKSKKSVAIVFGAPRSGIYDIVKDKFRVHELFDYVIDFVPDQGTRTVRTEEAIYSALSIINLLSKYRR